MLPKVNDFYLHLEVAIYDYLKTMCFIHVIGVSPRFRIFHWLLLLKASTKRCSVKQALFQSPVIHKKLQLFCKIYEKYLQSQFFSKVVGLQLLSKRIIFYILHSKFCSNILKFHPSELDSDPGSHKRIALMAAKVILFFLLINLL